MIELLWDWHGSLADFARPLAAAHGRELGPAIGLTHDLGIDAAEFWRPSELRSVDWWRYLPDIGPMEAVMLDASHDRDVERVQIVSSPASPLDVRPFEVMGTTAAATDRYKIAPWFVAWKADLYRPGRILVDDNQAQVNEWRARGGRAVLAPAPWNETRSWPVGDSIFAFRALLLDAILREAGKR